MNDAEEAQSTQALTPEENTRDYRRALGRFPTGVAVVTTAAGGERAGVTVNSFSSVSLDPPIILWSIDKASQSLDTFRNAAGFAVNVLASNQMGISNHFARSGGDKFSDIPMSPGRHDAPLLEGVAAVFECALQSEQDAGDHIVMFGRVERYRNFERSPLLFALGRYGVTLDHPQAAASSADDETPAYSTHDLTLGLIRQALDHYSSAFQADRALEGLTIAEGRVLFNVSRHQRISTESVATESFLSIEKADETLAALSAYGYVSASAGGFSVTANGDRKLNALRERAKAFDSELFSGVPAEEIEIARNFLKRIVQRTGSKT